MRPVPPKHKKIIDSDPFFKTCIHEKYRNQLSPGRITIEHCFIYARRQICEVWNYVPCKWEFNVGAVGDIKDFNKYVALLRCKQLGEWERIKVVYSKFNWEREFERLEDKFGLMLKL